MVEIILKEDIEHVGSRNELVKVRPGYARNYLIPKGLAIVATTSARKVHAENMRQQSHKEAKVLTSAQVLAEKLAAIKLTIGAKAGENGRIFGSVNAIQVAEALGKAGHDIDRKRIGLKDDHIKELGEYQAQVRLHKDVIATVSFEVVAE